MVFSVGTSINFSSIERFRAPIFPAGMSEYRVDRCSIQHYVETSINRVRAPIFRANTSKPGLPKVMCAHIWCVRRAFLMCARGFSNSVVFFFKKKNSTLFKKNTTNYLILDIKNTTKSYRFEKNTTKLHFLVSFVQKKHNKAIFWYG